MRRRNIWALLLSVLLMAVILAGCNSETEETQPDDTSLSGATEAECVQQNGGQDVTETSAVDETPVAQDVVVSTAFGDLHYQEQWEEFVRTEQMADTNFITVSFSAEINGTRYHLFDVIIGEGEGEPVGQLTDASGTVRDVFVFVDEIITPPDMAEDQYNQLCAMQEDINYVISNLK